jgi:outer membrane receptor protein involved in Fe transport
MPFFSKKSIALAVLTGLAVTSTASAQIEEIVVTATKRASTLQEIPIAVSVTTADTMEKANILDINDLQSVVPSLRVSQLQNSTNTNFVIRGFGNGANNPGIEPSVGVFIDGVYRSRSAASISDLPKLERVEVLRGPQSTLFGKNASAGVISVVTAKPSGEKYGKVSATVGNFGAFQASGYYENALSDTAAFSISASTNTRDGYVTNLTSGAELNDRDRQAFRAQLVMSPGDNTEIRFIADYDTIDELCCATVNLLAGPTLPAINFAGGTLVANDPEALTTYGNSDTFNELDNSGISMQIDHDFENIALTSITSFRKVDSYSNIDADFTSADIIQNDISTEIDTFSQEIRLASTNGDKVDWMIGGYLFDESVDYVNNLPFGDGYRRYLDAISFGGVSTIEGILGLPFGTFGNPNSGVREVSTLENDAISLFGSLDFHISDRLTATVGLNYTKDEKAATTTQTDRDLFSSIDLVQLGGALIAGGLIQQGVPAAQAAAIAASLANTSANPLLPLQPVQFLPPFVDFPNAVEDGKTDDDELTYNIRLAFDVNDNVNAYIGMSTGFKATSWNLSRDSRPFPSDIGALTAAGHRQPNLVAGTRFAGPEEAEVVELGVKASFDRGSFNLAIFDQSIKGFQSNVFTGTGFALASAGEQSTKGLEFDLRFFPTESLELTLAGTFLDPKYDSFERAGFVAQTGEFFSLTGRQPAGINETSMSAGATYSFMLGNNDAYVRADYFYEDTVPIGDVTPSATTDVSVFSRDSRNLNISAGMTTGNGLSLQLWARNVTDHVSLISAFPSVAQSGSFSGYRTQPRTYGLTVSKEF